MAHVMKMTKGAVGHMTKHYERAKDENGEYIKFGNENIDSSRTNLNYNLAPNRDISQGEFVKQRCSEVQCLNRKDVNVMCSWVVTAPEKIKGKEKEFFEQTYKFLKNRYGEKNVVSAHVHMDEVTPHMHFAFVPVVYDPKKDIEKVSAKLKVCKSDLQTFHKDLEGTLERYFGHEVGILNQATKEGNKTIIELKRESIAQVNKELTSTLDKLQAEKEALRETTNSLYGLEHIQTKKSLIGAKITLSEKDFNGLMETAKKGVLTTDKLQEENFRLKESLGNYKEDAKSYKDALYKAIDEKNQKIVENTNLKEQGRAMLETLKEHNLIPEAQARLKTMKAAKVVAKKVLNKSRDCDMER